MMIFFIIFKPQILANDVSRADCQEEIPDEGAFILFSYDF